MSSLGHYISIESIVFVHIKMNKHIYTFTINQFWLELLHTYMFLLHLYLYVSFFTFDRKKSNSGWIYFDAWHQRSKQTFSKSVTSFVFLKKKLFSYNNLFLCTYYIHTSWVAVQLYICKYRDRLTWIRSSREQGVCRRGQELETQRGHKFSGSTAKSV